MKGRTNWYPRDIHPVRNGVYECYCIVLGRFIATTKLQWDGIGFISEMPLGVIKWRGLTRKEYLKQTKVTK